MRRLPPEAYQDLVRRALAEDVGAGDVTTDATVPPGQRARGRGAESVVAQRQRVQPVPPRRVGKGADGRAAGVGLVQVRSMFISDRPGASVVPRLSCVRVYLSALVIELVLQSQSAVMSRGLDG